MLEGLGRGRCFPEDVAYAVRDDACIVPQSSGCVGNMTEVILKMCTTLDLTGSQAKTATICLHGKDTPTVEFNVHAAGHVHKQTDTLVDIGAPSQTHPASLWRSRDECSERSVTNVGTYAKCIIDRPRT